MKRSFNLRIVLSGFLFSVGYLVTLINIYYQFKYQLLIENRVDLIARLGFMSYTTGFIFYPCVLIPIGILSWSFKNKFNSFKGNFFSSTIGVLILAVAFYTKLVGNLVFGNILSVVSGLVLIILSVILFYKSTNS
ncbi:MULTISPECIES: hypothetical protein [Mesonia]|uniref:Uncharacterized protein n=1 Tax=Mesonia oceanica TaxID=2687242 RepID=A0AC61Y532_9FLAO|nr:MULTISPECIES: hypothetical protein [Mesonia]MAN26610.1 hypothetical protein [Mesonia sp.]MAQ40878.1 hypothetical protein [Mesonia sp.]MBJ97799.1 hypothetical protein [Flavobacteriaceae bacterium]VVU99507.1 hypothetical protein FVB9532_00761 [Mesonia oceanica]|tara:strand:+ start:5192 stop:5596 length:405 start_codon:yes stop_codon:yes gene_type:complete